MDRAIRIAGHGLIVAFLTVLTQVGGVAWLLSLGFPRRWLGFPLAYAVLFGVAHAAAPALGRQAVPCFGEPLRMQSVVYCLTLRNFVTPEMAQVARTAAEAVAQDYPGTVTLALDGSFPFLDGMPLLPHLSHDDGRKLDFAFYYTENGTYAPGVTRSPFGYWAFELDNETDCPPVWLTTRWNMTWAQGLWPDRPLEPQRTAALVRALVADPRVGKVFLEPPLERQLGLEDAKLRFQGCRAARHDDHIHAQL
ncbi:MAG: hypothetical protein INF52_11295 [Rhodobacter sp.]|nr:hypothetical protein [Rhodobacter sp.]